MDAKAIQEDLESLGFTPSLVMTQSNSSSPRSQKYLRSPRGVMAVEVPQNEESSVKGKGVGSGVRRRRANRGSINIKEGERGGVV